MTAKAPGSDLFYLDDLHVGFKFRTGSHTMEQARMKAFASEFDPQPFHLDDAAAAKSIFGSLAASGWHTAAITMRLLVESGAPIAGGIVGRGGEISWPQPTRAGDTVHVESEVVEVTPSRSRPDRGTIVIRSETRNQRGEIVQTLLATLMVPRRVS
jgi:acyl dehydratase